MWKIKTASQINSDWWFLTRKHMQNTCILYMSFISWQNMKIFYFLYWVYQAGPLANSFDVIYQCGVWKGHSAQ